MPIDYAYALAGGGAIGAAAALLLLTHGRIAGVSGLFGSVVARLLSSEVDALNTRVAFLLGLVGTAAVLALRWPARFDMAGTASLPVLALAGLLIGFGTRISGGCTSGHGVCGISRGSPRSLAATLTFVLTAMVTVFVARQL